MSSFIKNNRDIEEEDEEDDDHGYEKTRRDSDNFQMPQLKEEDQAKLNSCIDEVRSVVGDTVSEKRIVETSIRFGYDIEKILDEILNDSAGASKEKEQQLMGKTTVTTKPTSRQQQLQPQLTTVRVTDTVPKIAITVQSTANSAEARRGFDVSSPQLQSSPVVSGRNTPVVEFQEDAVKGAAAAVTAATFKVSKEQSQRNGQQLYTKERSDQKAHFHMIVIGHVDAGKSTLMGHMLFDMGNVSQRVMHKYEQDSKKLGKQSFMYAWVLDETGEERARG